MWLHLKSLSKQTVIYGGGMLLMRSISFLMVPVYTRYLRPADYGTLEILDLTSYILAYFVGFGLLRAVFRFHAAATDDHGRREVKTNALMALCVVGGTIALLLVLNSKTIAEIAAGSDIHFLVQLLLVGMFFNEAVELMMGFFRVESRPMTYMGFSFGNSFARLSLNIVLLVFLGLGVKGILISSIIVSVTMFTILLVRNAPGQGWTPHPTLVRQMLFYAIPFIPSGLMGFAVQFADRYFLRYYADMSTVGIYALGYKLGMVAGFLIGTPFGLVWEAKAFEIAGTPEAPRVFGRVLTYYAAGLLAVCVGLSVYARELVEILAPPDYDAAAQVIPIVAWAIALLNLSPVVQIGTLLEKKTAWLPVVYGGSATINMTLNFLLIPKYTMMGAAWATLAAFLFQVVASGVLAHRIRPIVHYEWPRLAALAVAALAAYAVTLLLPAMPLVTSIVAKIPIAAAAIVVPWLAPGFMTADERQIVARSLVRGRQWLGRGNAS